MKKNMFPMLGIMATAGIIVVSGCNKKPETEPSSTAGVGERAGIALDQAAEKTVEVAKSATEATKKAAKSATEATKEAAKSATEATKEAAKSATEATKEAFAQMTEAKDEIGRASCRERV